MQAKCLCGDVEFEFEPVDDMAMSCFCSLCRRSHGADYATQLISNKETLKITKGEELITEFSSSEFGVRAFCSKCGSRLMNYAKAHSNYMSVALSSVVSEHNISPAANVQVGSKAAWVNPNPDIKSFDEFPPDIGKYM